MKASTALVMDIDHFSVHDGPGIRTCVYFKGCPLSCAWCHSPESQKIFPQLLYRETRCMLCGECVKICPKNLHKINEGKHKFDQTNCDNCGRCSAVCLKEALVISGKEWNYEDLFSEVISDEVFFRNSGGGVTLTGGELLLQADFAGRFLRDLKHRGIDTIIETSGYGNRDSLLMLSDYVSVFYYDFKLADPEKFCRYIGKDPSLIWNNLEELRKKTDSIVLRLPLIPSITDTEENVKSLFKLAEELKIYTVHFLPYNFSAGVKYKWLGRDYSLSDLDNSVQIPEELLKIKIEHPNINVEIIR